MFKYVSFLFLIAYTKLQENNIFMHYIYIKKHSASNYGNQIVDASVVKYEWPFSNKKNYMAIFNFCVPSNKKCGIIS